MTDSYFDQIRPSIMTTMGAGSTLLSILCYVLTALALYTLASRRGIRKPWLAWIPVVNVWILGSLSDQYRYVVRGEVRSKRKWLLGLSIAETVLTVVMIGMLGSIFISAVVGALRNASESYMIERLLRQLMTIILIALPLLGVSIAYMVLHFMALYDIYTSCDPRNNVLFLVLSILIGITRPIFLFCNRKKDYGMPPRRPVPSQPGPESWNEQPEYADDL